MASQRTLAVLLGGLGIEVGADESDGGAELSLVRQLVAKEEHRRANDAHTLDHVAHAVRHWRHA